MIMSDNVLPSQAQHFWGITVAEPVNSPSARALDVCLRAFHLNMYGSGSALALHASGANASDRR